MSVSQRWTIADLDLFPDDGKRREIIDGELFVSTQPHYRHQRLTVRIAAALENWSETAGNGEVSVAPGIVFAEDEAVAPDVVWMSRERATAIVGSDGHLHAAPELVIEILSPGGRNEYRDREAKVRLYSRQGVQEYWLLDPRTRTVQVFRRENAVLQIIETLYEQDTLTPPLLPDFALPLVKLYANIL